jgi:hypothetical protein
MALERRAHAPGIRSRTEPFREIQQPLQVVQDGRSWYAL